jgi:branched-chain amino acid transport system permease protein
MDLVSQSMAGLELNFSTLPSQLVNGILIGSIYALIALGYTMVYGVLRLINFAHGEVYMLGAYTALFVSWWLGFTPDKTAAGTLESNALNLVIMLLASMSVCALIGVVIERFAYRPMRSQPRIASLITAIGVSLMLQYGGSLFLPNNPPPAISEQVNPFRGVVPITLAPPDASLQARVSTAKTNLDELSARYTEHLKTEADQFNLSPEGKIIRDEKFAAERAYNTAKNQFENSGVQLRIPKGQLIMLIASVVLMILLRQLVMKTTAGRAMRAVSHDFDSASLMGVNVNRVVTLTFVIGSALAGAGAMMTATFLGTAVSPFYGVQPGVKAFVAAVLGGIGNIPGAVLGGLLMGVAENLVVWVGYSSYKDAIAFVVLIVVLLFRPGGILGSSKVEKV